MNKLSTLVTLSMINLLPIQYAVASCDFGQTTVETSATNLAQKYWQGCKVLGSHQSMNWESKKLEGWDVSIQCESSPVRKVSVTLKENEDKVCRVESEKIIPLSGKNCGLTDTYGRGDGETPWSFSEESKLSLGSMSDEELKKLPELVEYQLSVLNKTEPEGDILALVKNLKEGSEAQEVYLQDFTYNNVEYTDAVFYPGGNPVGAIFKKSTYEVVAYNGDGDIVCEETLSPLPAKPTFETTEQTMKVDAAIEMIRPLAGSGVSFEKVSPSEDVKTALLKLGVQVGYIESEEEMSWSGTSDDAWDGDSTNWGETTAAKAIEYIGGTYDDESGQYKYQVGSENQIVAQKAVELLQQTGVLFGVVPLGAIQCGFTYAALAIIEPSTGRIFIFSRESSGC